MEFSSSQLAQITSEADDRRPVQRFGRGDIQVAVWANKTWDGGNIYKATVSRRFRRRDGTWASTSSFLKHELRELIDVLELAREEMRD